MERKTHRQARRLAFESPFPVGARPETLPVDGYPGVHYFCRGRDALQAIIQALGLPRGSGVLLPALACPEVYRPFLDAGGCAATFYPVGRDLQPDLPAILRKAGDNRAVLLIDYFGMTVPRETIEALRSAGLVVVLDESHSFLSRLGEPQPAEYCFASLRKLLPLVDGAFATGLQAPPGFAPDGRLAAARFRMARGLALRLAGSAWDRPRRIKHTLVFEAFSAAERALSRFPSPAPMSSSSRARLCRQDLRGIALRRRENFSRLASRLAGVHAFTPVFGDLPEGVVPFGYPVYCRDRELWIAALRAVDVQAAPLWDLDPVVPPEAAPDPRLFREIMVLPVSQHMEGDDIDVMAERIGGLAR